MMNRRPRRRVSGDWISRLRDRHELPPKGGPAWNEFLGWQFFQDEVEGLPMAQSDEGRELIAKAAWPKASA